MELRVEKVHKGMKIAPENIGKFGKDEIERVKKALEDAARKKQDLEHSNVMTREKMTKIKELAYAIGVGNLYLAKLKRKWE
ncbi:MAG: hypothetical protein U9Q67_02690 [Patescibacteria group bacterium]|nr:hypothetical protein [Patescibacteria group bacterium]